MTTRTDTFLSTILASTRVTLDAAKESVPVARLERRATQHRPRGWAAALRSKAATGPAVIAEIKKASPSKGLIRADFDPEWLARRYRAGGAAALSVLTDEPFFQGSLRNLELASAAAPLPCLRKDFIIDEYQIVEARAHRADAILLIAAALGYGYLEYFTIIAHQHGLDVLCEVHTPEEIDLVKDLGCDAYGVNNRDLKTFEVRLETSLQLADKLPPNAVHVSESGIHTAADIQSLRTAGFHAFLIGESLMRQPQPGAALETLLRSVDQIPAEILTEQA
jgi:indole-3-glycerol phosphate synthase